VQPRPQHCSMSIQPWLFNQLNTGNMRVMCSNGVRCILLQLGVIELIVRKDNQLRPSTLLNNPSWVCSMLLHKHDQCKTFNVDGLQIHEAGPSARNNQCMQDNKPNWINSTI
jgi:hypothetical protein